MLQGQRIAVVVPAFNEARHIAACLASVPHFVDRVVVVDDASGDGTARRALAAGDGRLLLVRHGQNEGVGAAILTGYRVAFGLGMDIAVVMAGDGQMHPDDMPGLLLPLLRKEADYCKGARRAWPSARRIIPRSRWLGIRALEVLTRLSTGLRGMTDFQCGYTALRLSVLPRVDLGRVYPRYGFPNDFLNHLVLAEARIAERVVRPIYAGEASGLRIPAVVAPLLGIIARGTLRRVRHRGARRPQARALAAEWGWAGAEGAGAEQIGEVWTDAHSPLEAASALPIG